MAKARPIIGVDCYDSAAAGITVVLTDRLAEMCTLRQEALNWKDPEGVHSMRVASRRLRSALSDFRPFLNNRALVSVLKQIKAIADALGDVRDQDVAIEALERLRSHSHAGVSEALKEIISDRKDSRRSARSLLKESIAKQELKQLMLHFGLAIASATKDHRASTVSYVASAQSIVLARLDDLEKLSDCLYHPLAGEALHEMRIAGKRLRYALELFAQCWGDGIVPFAKQVAALQSALGDLHDCDVWIESFGKEIIRSRSQKKRNHSEAFTWLMSHFVKARNGHLRDSLSLWREWEEGKMSAKLRELIGGQ